MQWPYDKLPRVTSPFGWRKDPLGRAPKKHHNGVDFGAALGTPIESVSDGKVIIAGPSKAKKKDGSVGGFGYFVRILFKFNGEFYTATYAHLVEGSLQVKAGQKVKAGQVIGKTGSSGDSTGPHLHLEIQKGKTYVWTGDGTRYLDPIAFLKNAIAMTKVLKSADEATDEDAPVAELPAHKLPKPEPKKPVAKPVVYKVKKGDSYWSIAQAHGLDFKVIQKLNKNKPLKPNDTIKLK